MKFVNRTNELAALERWWARGDGTLGLVWGRRRIGKTALLQRFAQGKRAVYHTAAGRPEVDELRILSRQAAPVVADGVRDLEERPFRDWTEAFETLAMAARDTPTLLVLDEFPELVRVTPAIESTLRAIWDRARTRTRLRVLLCGSAVRTMEAIQEERAPLYGRVDLSLLVGPLRPHEVALMLPRLTPAERALVWSIVGGVPLYLERWDQDRSVRDNLADLICTPGGLLLTAGDLAMSSEVDTTDLTRQVLYAIGAGRSRHKEIADAVRAEPARTLDRLVRLGLLDRVAPVTEDPRRTRRRAYRILDNFLAFWLGVVDRYRTEIERGLGSSILPVLIRDLDDHAGPRFEEAFRMHLRLLADAGELGGDVVAVGPFWTQAEAPVEIDAVVLSGRDRRVSLVGEAKWARRVDARPLRRDLERRAAALPRVRDDLRYAICARETVDHAGDVLAITAADIFPNAG
jgi:AAA+ ATPase superfamily predicted ATPase